MSELKRTWQWHVAVIAGLVAALLIAVFASSARADFGSYCGHGYITDGKLKDVYKSYYNAPSGHHHIYYSYIKISGIWFYEHKHDRLC